MFDFSDLVNILDSITAPDIIGETDYFDILDLAGDTIHEYVSNNYLRFADPSFHSDLIMEVSEEVLAQIADAFNEDIELEVDKIVDEAARLYFTHVVPRRSYMNSEVYGKLNIGVMAAKIDYLMKVPQPDQRTDEWYRYRHDHLTASSLWKAFSTQSNINQLIYGKCVPLDVTKYGRVNLDSPLHWGQKYEDVSIAWYENKYNTKVRDFGCIPHKRLGYLAASPDGINVSPDSPKYGRMLEVKNIVNRDITGIPKYDYWIQMQVQMEVCELSECDFLETRFIEYEDYEEFSADGTFTHTADGKPKGVMLLFVDSNGDPIYKRLPIGSGESEYASWNASAMSDMSSNATWLRTIYWKLDEVSVVLVKRNKKWFSSAEPILTDLWKTIEHERQYGYEHRAPRKRPRLTKDGPLSSAGVCLIKLDEGPPACQVKNDTSEDDNTVIIDIETEALNDADQSFEM